MARRTPQFLLVATTAYVPPVLYRDLGVSVAVRNPDDEHYQEKPVTARELQNFDGLIFWVNPTTNIEFLQRHVELVKQYDNFPLVFIVDGDSIELPPSFQDIPHQLNFRNAVIRLLPHVRDFHPPVVVPALATA
jgi:hypothetical protein